MLSFRNASLGIGCAYILYRTSAALIRNYFIAKLTALNELSEIGTKSTRKGDKLRGTVVICGGSIAGLLAAKVCSDHFENVIIVESEEWVTTPEGYTGSDRKELANKKRSHVAQYKAAHMFQTLLVETLAKWFPNMKEECEKLGGRVIPQMWPIVISGIPLADSFTPRGSHPTTIRITRRGFETLLRRLVMNSCKNIRYLAGTALALEQASGSNLITGVRVRTSKKEEITLPAVLAIDCTGANSAGLRWLRDLATAAGNEAGIQQLDNLRLTYDPRQAYRTCEFDVPPELIPRLMEAGFPSDWDSTGMVLTVFPDLKLENKFFSVTRKDHDYLELLCGGWAVSDEISNVEDIRSFVSSLRLYKPLPTWVFRLLDLLEENHVPCTIDYTRLGPAVYIPFDKYDYMPSNFVAMGDSVMRINPVRGVGCTKACIEALSLNRLLNTCHRQNGAPLDLLPDDFSQKFHKVQASRIGPDWDGYKAEDYVSELTVPSKGEDRKTFGKSKKAFGRLLLRTALKDKYVAVTLGYVRCFLAPPTDLFAPRILLKLLKVKLFDKSPLL